MNKFTKQKINLMLPIHVQSEISPQQLEWLQEVWEITTDQMQIPKVNSDLIFEELKNRYSEPHRAYHNFSHIYSMLKMADDFYDMIEFNGLLEMSIWFHDLIYDPLRKDNEEKSAVRAVELLHPFFSEEFLERLHAMILSTAKHTPLLSHHDNKMFLDLDLAILASEKNIYQQYTHAIRKEYEIFPDDIYTTGRKSILKNFLKRDKIYFTSFFQTTFEEKARENIRTEDGRFA